MIGARVCRGVFDLGVCCPAGGELVAVEGRFEDDSFGVLEPVGVKALFLATCALGVALFPFLRSTLPGASTAFGELMPERGRSIAA